VIGLVKIIQKDERIIAAVQFEIKLFDLFLLLLITRCLYLYGHIT